MTRRDVPVQACPRCSTRLDCATNMTGESAPDAGDLTICIECGCILVFLEGLKVRALTGEEFRDLPAGVKMQLFEIELARRHVNSMRN